VKDERTVVYGCNVRIYDTTPFGEKLANTKIGIHVLDSLLFMGNYK
jgi:hypothetical protein